MLAFLPAPAFLPASWLVFMVALVLVMPTPARAQTCGAGAGPLRLAVVDLQAAYERTQEPLARARAAAALGAAWLKLGREDDAARALQLALSGPLPPAERAAVLIDQGILALTQRRNDDADEAWRAAAALAPGDAEIALTVELNRLRLPEADERAARLRAALARSAQLPDALLRARHVLNIAAQAAAMDEPAGTELAQRAYQEGLALALSAVSRSTESRSADSRSPGTRSADPREAPRLAAEAYEGQSALQEAAGRADDALRLVELGIAQARQAQARDLLLSLEGRAGRLAARLRDPERSLAAYRRAVEHVEAVRSDIPVRYQDGRSSYRDTLEPLYLGLTDQLLRRSEAVPVPERAALLRQARDTVELIKQTELEDWLRNRCGLDPQRRTWAPPAGSALLHPIILPDRLELLIETARGIERRSTAITGDTLRGDVQAFVTALRERRPLRPRAEALYRALVAPLEPLLAAERIDTLVVVPDGVLRLLPFAALHDGKGWLLQRFAFATVPGLSLTPVPRRARVALAGPPLSGATAAQGGALLAGMAEPGPVLDKLPRDLVDSVLEPPGGARTPAGPGGSAGTSGTSGSADTAGSADSAGRSATERSNALREALALPGVRQEIETLARVLPGTVLLDRAFTLDALKVQMRTSAPAVVHIASHGVFGASAETTFIMTWDDLLTLDGLQALLREGRPRDAGIELLTLSACQTAEGDDRAPLGMSGTALKARARTVLGTLWPVSDEAAEQVMGGFYGHLAAGRLSRAAALRDAQLALMAKPRLEHPFFWAPFVLIGDWQ
jgi:CHAT domain-containing protein